jgi:gliding motility-associated-like protein
MKHLFRIILLVSFLIQSGLCFAGLNATLKGATSACQNSSSATLTFTASGGIAPYTFSFLVNSGFPQQITTAGTDSVATFTVPTTAAGPYTYTLTSVTDGSNATASISSQSVTVVVNATPSISGTFTVCSDTKTTRLTGSGTAASANTWSSSTPSVATIDNSGNVTVAGTGYTTITYTDNNGCSTSSTFKVIPKPTVDFSFTNNQCSGSPIAFTSNASGTGALTYLWNFGDGQTSTNANPSHFFIAPGTGTQTFNVLLTVTDNAAGCTNSIQKTVTVQQAPDASLNSDQSSITADGITTFKNNCTNNATTFTFYNKSTTQSTSDVAYQIDWGDGSTPFTATSWTQTPHLYTTGLWTLTYTVTGNKGCNTTRTYKVFVGSNPGVGLVNPGNTDICQNETITFQITGTDKNPLGTTYSLSFGDGSDTTFVHPAPTNISHTYTKSSCGYTTPDGTQNSFYVKIIASNPCSSTPGSTAIRVSTPPIADFNLQTKQICTNSPVSITNTTAGGYEIEGSTCNNTPKIVWKISPSAGVTLQNGTLGDDSGTTNPNVWSSGSSAITPKFANPGKYTITLITGNKCGNDSKSQTICVEPPLAAQFKINGNTGCAPVTITTENQTDTSKVCSPPTYKWSITYTSGYCGTTSSYTFINGTSAASRNPSIRFNNPGTYHLTLSAKGTCSSYTPAVQDIIVTQPPVANINTVPDLCGPGNITPTANITSCTTSSATLTYQWSFPGGTPSASVLANPGTIAYAQTGKYQISLTVHNDCGWTTATKDFTVNHKPVITNTVLNQTTCSNMATTVVHFTADTAGVAFTWTGTAPNSLKNYRISGSGDLPSQKIINTGNTPANVTYTITPSVGGGGCSGTPVTYTITVNPALAIVSNPESSSVCQGGIAKTLKVVCDNVTGTPTYQWYNNSTSDTGSGAAVPGANSDSYDPPTGTIGTVYYYCIVSSASGGCNSPVSDPAAVTVSAIPVITRQPVPLQTVCVGGSVATPLGFQYSGGAGNVTYQWYSSPTANITDGTAIPGATSATYTPTAFTTSGTYYYFVNILFGSSSCGNITSDTARIDVVTDPVITSQPEPAQTICPGVAAIPLTVTAQGGTGTFHYQWYKNNTNNNTSGTQITGATTDTYTPASPSSGTTYYYCIVTQAAAGCSVTSNTAAVTAAASISKQPQPYSVCLNGTPTALSVSYVNGSGTPTYQWFENTIDDTSTRNSIDGANGPSYTPGTSTAGTTYYYCIITLPSGSCPQLISSTAAVTVNPMPQISDKTVVISSGSGFSVTPDNRTDGDVVPDGTTYTWSMPSISPAGTITGASGQTSAGTSIRQTLTNTTQSQAKATYTVIPLSGNCQGSSFKITVTVNPSIKVTAVVNNCSCHETSDGSIHITISGGVPFSTGSPQTVTWTGPNGFSAATADIANLAPGTYNLNVSDAGGFPFNGTYVVTRPNAIAIGSAAVSDVTCNGQANGSIVLNPTGGTGSYHCSWTKNGVAYSSGQNLTNLTAGTYSVSVTDDNHCGPVTASYEIKEPTALTISITGKTDVTCYGDSTGAVSIEASGSTTGTTGYTYRWTGPNGFKSTVQNPVHLAAGNYTATVTDSNGCTQTLHATISQPAEITAATTIVPIKCYGDTNGSISLSVNGGTPPYQFLWNTMATGSSQNNLGAGSYTIAITDANNCRKVVTAAIPSPALFMVTPVVKNISCYGAHDGSISLNIAGKPISVVWNDGSTAGSIRNNLGPGTYTATVSDGSPCTIVRTFVIIEPQPLALSAMIADALDCNNLNSGAITLQVSGGTTPYHYLWSTGATVKNLTAAAAGNYTVTVTDSAGCSITGQYAINRPKMLSASIATSYSFNCATKKLTSVNTATIAGGVPPYYLKWSDGTVSGADNETVATDKNGTVLLTITDSRGCSVTQSVNMDVPEIAITGQIVDCNKHLFGFDINMPSTLADQYSYNWNFGDGLQATGKAVQHTFASAGNYRVTLTISGNSCNASFTKVVQADAIPALALDRQTKLCKGDSLVIHATGATSYIWNTGATADSIVIRQPGNYNVIGSTAQGCTNTLNFTVTYYDSYTYNIYTDKNTVTPTDNRIQVWSEDVPSSLYYWDFGDTSRTVEGNNIYHVYDVDREGYYDIKLSVINPNGCVEHTSKRIWIVNDAQLNTFTPNGDGKNDTFLKGWRIRVYNRNGVLIYEGNDGWDGTYKGKPVAADTYFYIVYYMSSSGTKSREGYVTVVK